VTLICAASNMSGISTTQSTIAADLDAYESAMWFTSAYMISMSSVAPLAGRLAMIFSPATMVLLSSACFSAGALVTALAPSFAVFILGRVMLGIGSGGIMTLCMILVIQLTSKKRRGLWIGLTNAVRVTWTCAWIFKANTCSGVHTRCIGGCRGVWSLAAGSGMGT
jgi:MFS family permease